MLTPLPNQHKNIFEISFLTISNYRRAKWTYISILKSGFPAHYWYNIGPALHERSHCYFANYAYIYTYTYTHTQTHTPSLLHLHTYSYTFMLKYSVSYSHSYV